jgi:molybdate transport system substrate-binding protein
MAWLVAKGAIAGEPAPLLGNSLVLVQPEGSTARLKLDESLPHMLQGHHLAIGNPDHVPAGAYARDALRSLGLWEDLAALAVRTSDVRAALFLVSRGEAAAAVVYESDLESGQGVRLAARFPRDTHRPIIYPAAVVADGNRDAARELLDYLAGPEAGTVFRRHGFRTE